jgi:hypothetical protein
MADAPSLSERAADVRKQLQADLEKVCRVMDAAKAGGLFVTFSVRNGPDGRHVVDKIEIMAKL